jgi:hypothetical protein
VCGRGQAVAVGVQVHDLVAEALVVAQDLLDHLLRAPDQRRAAVKEVVQRREDHRQP